MQGIGLGRREVAAWVGAIIALILLGLGAAAARRAAARRGAEVRPVDPYRAEIERTDPVEIHTRSAYAYEAEGSLEMAVKEYLELVRTDPDDVAARANLAALYFKTGAPERAVAEIHEILRIDPSQFGHREVLADAYAEAGDHARAAREYEEALRYAPDSADLRCKLGREHLLTRRHALARDEFRKAVETDPESAEAHRGLAASLRALGEVEEAAREAALAETLRQREDPPLKPGRLPPYRPLRSKRPTP
ncbi:MAG: tetratricopeptide repeat protein [Candidatus Aureabacteria bacterium]|jgi:tetratricopeptide (TPR) repeat protein|nr:tetratricopeptide repeat protein [Candidatus Auribacterota bacterium]NLW93605.1 tetratricopeptide repeat protein [Chlamydiota bacterium]HOE27338.1 tetratricopeptide repeat protein [bacterium]HQM52479.1 tetratricopeptide repeat protein [bacterium]